ncbi:cytochrome P450 [soil metagenome]
MSTTTGYEFWTPEAMPDPYPIYRRLRKEAPILKHDNTWTLSRHRDVAALLPDKRMSAVRGQLEGLPDEERAKCQALIDVNRDMILFLDPADHTRLRSLVAQAFSARRIEGLRAHIVELVDQLLEDVEPGEPWDLIDVLANPLPGLAIAELVGVPTSEQEKFTHWANEYGAWLGSFGPDEELRYRANAAAIELSSYLRDLVKERRKQPQDDLLTGLIQAEDEGNQLNEQEMISTVFLLLFAGNETTTNLIGNGILTLLRHPEELERLRENPNLMRTAIEELLRFDGPVQLTTRFAAEPIDLDGYRIEAGDHIEFVLGAANRDPEEFEDPDRLDLGRRPNRHIGFGHGIHFCLGAPLARAQGQIAITTLINCYPTLVLADELIEWRHNPILRGLKGLRLVH